MTSLEISDVVIDYEPGTSRRRPVRKARALERLREGGASRRAVRLVQALPEVGGVLDPGAVDAMLVRAHAEMQRLWEELLHGQRVARVLRALLAAARATTAAGAPMRVIDVGCGTGYVVRWLALHGGLPDGVELVGADQNVALVNVARQLAEREGARCTFVADNALHTTEHATVFLSSGLLHHLRGEALGAFFGHQAVRAPVGFAHFDVQASWAAPVGSWLFHRARMREPIAQHDGVLSAVRAHPTGRLLEAARTGGPGYTVAQLNPRIPALPMLRALHAIVGVRPPLRDAFVAHLGDWSRKLGAWQ